MPPAFPYGPGMFPTQRVRPLVIFQGSVPRLTILIAFQMGVPSIVSQGFKFFNLPIQTSHLGRKMITLRVPEAAFVQVIKDFH